MDDALIAASHSFWKFLFKQNFPKIQIYKKKLCMWINDINYFNNLHVIGPNLEN